MSRMSACCLECGHTGNRSEFFKELKTVSPNFDDTCPKCLGDDIDVYLEGISFAAEES